MERLYNMADVIALVGWRVRNRDEYALAHQRVQQAVRRGYAGNVARMGRGVVLTKANVKQLVGYLRVRWWKELTPPAECHPEPSKYSHSAPLGAGWR
jgi:hypothetical protein